MGEDLEPTKLFFRLKRNWLVELLIKLKIIKPKYKEIKGIKNYRICGRRKNE